MFEDSTNSQLNTRPLEKQLTSFVILPFNPCLPQKLEWVVLCRLTSAVCDHLYLHFNNHMFYNKIFSWNDCQSWMRDCHTSINYCSSYYQQQKIRFQPLTDHHHFHRHHYQLLSWTTVTHRHCGIVNTSCSCI